MNMGAVPMECYCTFVAPPFVHDDPSGVRKCNSYCGLINRDNKLGLRGNIGLFIPGLFSYLSNLQKISLL